MRKSPSLAADTTHTLQGVSVLYNETKTAEWLDGLLLNAGLVDYR